MAMAPSSSSSVTYPSAGSPWFLVSHPTDAEVPNLNPTDAMAPPQTSKMQESQSRQDHGIPAQAIAHPISVLSNCLVSSSRPVGSKSPDNLVGVVNVVRDPPVLTASSQPRATDVHVEPSTHQTLQRQQSVRQSSSSPATRSLLHQKVNHMPTITSITEYKMRDKDQEDSLIISHGRRVRLSDSTSVSLYPLCRSWVLNGRCQENQLLLSGGGKTFPKPFPANIKEDHVAGQNDGDNETDVEFAGSVDEVSPQELLRVHINCAKKIRARLKRDWERRTYPYRLRVYSIIERIRQADAEAHAPRSDLFGVFGHPVNGI